MSHEVETIRAAAAAWRSARPEYAGGVVLVWQGQGYGWKNHLRDAAHERPGAYAVDDAGHVFVAEGGDYQNGAKCWVVVAPEN